MKAKERAKLKSLERFKKIKRLREINAPIWIIKTEQLRMARNRQGILHSNVTSPAFEASLRNMGE